MMTRRFVKVFLPFLLAAGMAGCQKERDFPEPEPTVSALGIVEEAKGWFERNRSGSSGGELDLNSLVPDWEAHHVDRNKAGQAVLTVPVANRSEPGREYMELAYVADGRGGVGVVKHYVGDLANGEGVGLRFYDVRGRLFVQGRYDVKTGLFSPVAPLAVSRKGKLDKIASMSGWGSSTSEEPVSNPNNPIVIDEVIVYPPDNGCYYCGSWPPSTGGGGGNGDSGGNGGGVGNGNGGGSGGGTGVPAPPGNGWGSSSTLVAAAPDVPIDLQERLNCFGQVPSNANTLYRVTLHVDKGNYYSFDVGHTFITLEKSNGGSNFQRLSYGFYPQNGLKSTTGQPVTSKMGEDSGRESDIRYTVNVGAAVFQNAINMSLNKASKDYELYNYNCTHYALDVFNIVLPAGSQVSGISTPNGLYDLFDEMSNIGINRNKIEGGNLPKSTDCN